ncbi:hypothetical protein E4U61_006494 [Claviceps capensis]|nr:hypothetical protein E4U61_006494 [Claviceps capensis]
MRNLGLSFSANAKPHAEAKSPFQAATDIPASKFTVRAISKLHMRSCGQAVDVVRATGYAWPFAAHMGALCHRVDASVPPNRDTNDVEFVDLHDNYGFCFPPETEPLFGARNGRQYLPPCIDKLQS